MENAFLLSQFAELNFPKLTRNLVGPDSVRLMNIKFSNYKLSDANVLRARELQEG